MTARLDRPLDSSVRKPRRVLLLFLPLAGVLTALVIVRRDLVPRAASRLLRWYRGTKTVSDRMAEYGTHVAARLAPPFAAAGVSYPPSRVLFAVFKLERRLELYAAGPEQDLQFIKPYPVLAASGTIGPKLIEGDQQVPEGTYAVEALNPNSLFHLALRLAYPSPLDREMAIKDGRSNLGSDIMIHRGSSSVGCIAVGDDAIEELFVLTASVGLENVSVLIAPVDFRYRELPLGLPSVPSWTGALYARVRANVRTLPGHRLTPP